MTPFMKERAIWACLCGLLAFVSIYTIRLKTARADTAETRFVFAADATDRYKLEIRRLQMELQSLEAHSRKEEQGGAGKGEMDNALSLLKQKGLKDPIHSLMTDLRLHPGLIPHSGDPTIMRGFPDSRGLRLLDTHWAVASFADGNTTGKLLLRYEVSESGKIFWHALDSYQN